jgi:hypothetical protein
MNVRLLVEFVDGSKTMVEMAAIANATGLVPDIAGMHGPKAAIDELNRTLIPKEDGAFSTKPAWSIIPSGAACRRASSSLPRWNTLALWNALKT